MFFVGDLHGYYNKLKSKICYNNNSNYIQLGDFGVGFSENDFSILNDLNDILVEYNSNLFVLRGNHDNPEFWNGNSNYSNITFVKDNSVLDIEGHSIYFLGGGISIDRVAREINYSYWLDESVDYNIILDKEFDIICTHVPYRDIYPSFMDTSSIVRYFSEFDKNLLTDLEKENKFMKYVNDYIQRIDCKYWFSGHFHESCYMEKNGILYKSLNIDEYVEF